MGSEAFFFLYFLFSIFSSGGGNALSRDHRLAEGDGAGPRDVSVGTEAPTRGDLRHALPDHSRVCVGGSEPGRRLGKGIGQGEGAVPGGGARLARRSGHSNDHLRTTRV